MGNDIIVDGHTFVDRGDGVYVPDQEYELNSSFGLGEQYDGKTFLIRKVMDARYLVAFVTDVSAWPVLWKMQDDLRSAGVVAVTTEGWNPNKIGGIIYAV